MKWMTYRAANGVREGHRRRGADVVNNIQRTPCNNETKQEPRELLLCPPTREKTRRLCANRDERN